MAGSVRLMLRARSRVRTPVYAALAGLAASVLVVLPGLTAPAHAALLPVPGHTTLVPDTPRTNTPMISNGEIWDMASIGNRIFIVGSFSTIKNKVGAGTTYTQRYLASYNIDTGLVDATFRPTFDGTVNAVTASPDGTKLFVAGTFNTVNGVTSRKVASLNLTTGTPVPGFSFAGATNNQATAIVASNTTVYVGGRFTKLNGVNMGGLAAVNATTGAVDPQFQNPIDGGVGLNGVLSVQKLKLTHDGGKLLVVHTGRRIAGQDRYGAALIDTQTKQLLPWRTTLWQDNLQYVGGVQRVYNADISPDDTYFVATSGSGGDRPPINDTAMAFPVAGGDNVQPLWISRHFDSVYSVAITEKAVYVGGHFSFEPSPTAPSPWPGLSNVGYGTGQGLSGYGLGDVVVHRYHLGALDPATGHALEWDPGSNSFEGNKALLATPRGLFSGGDTNIQGGVTTGRVAFFDFNSVPAAAQPDTSIIDPIEGRVETAGQQFTVTGSATTAATTRISKVQVNVQDIGSKQYMRADGTFSSTQYNFLATIQSPNTVSSTWSLPLAIAGTRSIRLIAKTFAANGTSDATKAVKKIEVYDFSDRTPTTGITSPPGGILTGTDFTVIGTASDDHGVSAVSLWFRDQSLAYLQDDGSVANELHTFRVLPDVVGATSATWRYDVSLPHTGNWTMGATAIDTAGQSALDNAARSWLIDPNAKAPTVSINAPAVMIPPTVSPTVQLAPGGTLTFSGGAVDDSDLANVEVSLRNSTTRENLGADGTWSPNNTAGWYRITGVNISGTSFNWSWTTPFTLKPGLYSFSVRATDDLGLITGSASQGRLTLNVQVPGDNPPDTTISPTGTISGVLVPHLDLTGTATDDIGVSRVAVSLFESETGRYLQPDGTLAVGFATIDASLGAGTTSRTWSLPVDLPANGNYNVTAYAFDTSNQEDVSTSGATSRYLVFPGDAAPTLVAALQSPAEGTAFTESRIVVSGRAEDDTSMADVQIAVIDSLGRYMSSSGAFTSTTASWRSSFLTSPGSAGSNYSYTTPVIPSGSYTVQVRAVDIHGQTTPTPTVVHVTVTSPPGNFAPVAHATYSCTNGNNCTFDARTSTDENAPTLTYSWNFGNGRTGTGPLPTMYFQTAGTFTVTLTAKDEYGLTGTTTLTVTTTTPPDNAAPVPVINPPACNLLVCNISGVGSADPNPGDSIAYLWDFGDGTATSTLSAPSHTFPVAGTYVVTLTVTDGWNVSTSTTRSMTVG